MFVTGYFFCSPAVSVGELLPSAKSLIKLHYVFDILDIFYIPELTGFLRM